MDGERSWALPSMGGGAVRKGLSEETSELRPGGGRGTSHIKAVVREQRE